jgi:hypothetical protein
MDSVEGTKASPLIEAVSARLGALLGGYDNIVGELERVNNRARFGLSDLPESSNVREGGTAATPSRTGHVGRLEDLADRLDALNNRLHSTVQSLAEHF